MSSKYQRISASEAVQTGHGTRTPPAQLMLDSLEEGYYSYRQMADRYGVHVETLRRLCRANYEDGTPKVNAPSEALKSGSLIVYVFTPEDVEELDAFFKKKGRLPAT